MNMDSISRTNQWGALEELSDERCLPILRCRKLIRLEVNYGGAQHGVEAIPPKKSTQLGK